MKSKYDKLLEKIDRTAYAVASMEMSLDNDDGDEEWRIRCEMARSKNIIILDSLKRALACVCEDDIVELRKLEARQIANQAKRERHEDLQLAQINAKLKIEENKTRQAEIHASTEEAKLELKREAQRAIKRGAEIKKEKYDHEQSDGVRFAHEMKRLLKERMGLAPYLEFVAEIKENMGRENPQP